MFAKIETILTRAWLQRGPLAWLLLPLAGLFGLLGAVRRRLYALGCLASTRLPVPVIVVGNIFVGGTGKTPFTIWLVAALRSAGLSPGVISRGYGSSGVAPRLIGSDSLPQEVGDEPLLIATRAACPVMVGRDRAATGQALLAAHPEINVLLSDDGLQHYALQRDIEIILCDNRGNGNGWLLPAGPLREPASRQRDFTVMNGSQTVAGIPPTAIRMQLEAVLAYRLSDRQQTMPLVALGKAPTSGKPAPRLLAAAGIGNPARFFASLQAAGLQFEAMPLADHYDYLINPFVMVDADIILITEKDAVKCRQLNALLNDCRIWVVPVTAQIHGALLDQLLEKLRGRSLA